MRNSNKKYMNDLQVMLRDMSKTYLCSNLGLFTIFFASKIFKYFVKDKSIDDF